MRAQRSIKDLITLVRHETSSVLASFTKDERLRPEFVCFGITDDCMLRCKMCRKWQDDIFTDKAKEASLEDWKRCVISLRRICRGRLQINFGGGEPLLKKETLELVSFCAQKGFATNIATNGYLIDEVMAEKINDSGLESIIISLDSTNRSVHDYLRGVEGAYDKAIGAIGLLDERCDGLYKGICAVIYDKNLDDILNLARWAQEDPRLNSVYFMAAMQPNNTIPDKRWYENEEFSMLWPRDKKKVHAVIAELIRLKSGSSKITNSLAQLEAFDLYYQAPERFVKKTKCNMDSALHVSSRGDVFLCYNCLPLGNISSDDVSRLWFSDKAKEARAQIHGCRNNCHFLLNCYFKQDYPFVLV